jgi:hypothetical protein
MRQIQRDLGENREVLEQVQYLFLKGVYMLKPPVRSVAKACIRFDHAFKAVFTRANPKSRALFRVFPPASKGRPVIFQQGISVMHVWRMYEREP